MYNHIHVLHRWGPDTQRHSCLQSASKRLHLVAHYFSVTEQVLCILGHLTRMSQHNCVHILDPELDSGL